MRVTRVTDNQWRLQIPFSGNEPWLAQLDEIMSDLYEALDVPGIAKTDDAEEEGNEISIWAETEDQTLFFRVSKRVLDKYGLSDRVRLRKGWSETT